MSERETAERVLREYGAEAEQECRARASYHEMQGNTVEAAYWRRMADTVKELQT